MLCTTIPVLLLVKESSRGATPGRKPSIADAMRSLGGNSRNAIVVLLLAQLFIYLAFASGQQLILLRVIGLNPAGSSLPIGIAFGAMGLAAGVTAATYHRLVPMAGFKWLAVMAGLLTATTFAAAAVSTTTVTVAASAALAGLAFGVAGSALQSMLGLEAPSDLRATLFGAMGGATSLGQGSGYLACGLLAAAIGLQTALSLSVTAALVMAVALWLWGREPPETSSPRRDADRGLVPPALAPASPSPES
jgi:MFS family permease